MMPQLKSALHAQIFGSPGYSCDLRLLPSELSLMHGWIIERGLTHSQVLDKANRLFSPNQVSAIKNFRFMDEVRYELGNFTLSDVVIARVIERGREEIYWRSVRPFEAGDVGPLHRDTDHHALVPGLHGPNETTVKAWVAIETEPGKNGIILIPESHRGNAGAELPLLLAPGEMVLFNENLLHRGMPNEGARNRVSVEITFVWGRE